jgi:hypothetical protein
VCLQRHDYAQAKDVLLALIDLSRNSIHRTPHYLGAYIQTLTSTPSTATTATTSPTCKSR